MNTNKESERKQLINMYLLANADGNFEEQEQLQIVEKALQFGLSHDELFDLISEAADYQNAPPPATLEEKVCELYNLAQIAWADGVIKQEEREMLISFAIKYGFVEENAGAIANYLLEQAQKGVEVKAIIDELQAN